MNTAPELNIYELDADELRRITASGPLVQPPGTWETQWNTLDTDIPDRITMLGAYQVTETGEVPVGLCGFRIVDTPIPGQEDGPHTIAERTAGALIALIEEEWAENIDIPLTNLELELPGVPAAANFAALLVAPQARRQGVGTKLHQFRNELLAQRFPDRPFPVFLTVAEYNTEAQALDLRQGFKVLRDPESNPLTVIRPEHHPAIDDAGNYPPKMENVPFIYMGKLLVPQHLVREN